MNFRRLATVVALATIIVVAGGCTQTSNGTTAKVHESPAQAADFRQAIEQPVTVNAATSPDGERLTVQFAVMAICKAAGNVPYQFEKSQQLAGEECRRFIEGCKFDSVPASEALMAVLRPFNLRYDIDDDGLFLTR